MKIRTKAVDSISNYKYRNPHAEIARTLEYKQILDHFSLFHSACQDASLRKENNKFAYVSYIQGNPGIGKSFICQKMFCMSDPEAAKNTEFADFAQSSFAIYYDLQSRPEVDYAYYLFDLANAISQHEKKASLFPRFSAAFARYQKLCGSELETINVQTTRDRLSQNSYISIASKAVSFLPGISDVIDTADSIVDLAGDVLQKGKELVYDQKYRQDFSVIQSLSKDTIKDHLLHYFILDFTAYQKALAEKSLKKRNHIVFILDTLECTAYQDNAHAGNESYLSWLVGPNGLIRYLPNTFWILAGRNDIPWDKIDKDSERDPASNANHTSFDTVKLEPAKPHAIKSYLSEQGHAIPSEFADYIEKISNGYTFKIELCIDTYFKMYNNAILKNNAPLSFADFKEVLCGEEHNIAISKRYLLYLDKNEKDALQMLACFEYWTDEFLSLYAISNDPSILISYRAFKKANLIRKQNGVLSLQGFDNSFLINTYSTVYADTLKEQLFRFLQDDVTDEHAFFLLNAYFNCSIRCNNSDSCIYLHFDTIICQRIEQAIRYLLYTKNYDLIIVFAEKLIKIGHQTASRFIEISMSAMNLESENSSQEYMSYAEALKNMAATDLRLIFHIWKAFFASLCELDLYSSLHLILITIRDVLPSDIDTEFVTRINKNEILVLTEWVCAHSYYEAKIAAISAQIDTLTHMWQEKKYIDSDCSYVNQKSAYESEQTGYMIKKQSLETGVTSNISALLEKTDRLIDQAETMNDDDTVRWYCRQCINALFSLVHAEDRTDHFLQYMERYENTHPVHPLDLICQYEMQTNYYHMLGDTDMTSLYCLKCIRLFVNTYGEECYMTARMRDHINRFCALQLFTIDPSPVLTSSDLDNFEFISNYYDIQIENYKRILNEDSSGSDPLEELKQTNDNLKDIISLCRSGALVLKE